MRRQDGRRRVVIEGVAPEIDGGRFPIKRTIGERVDVEADIFAEGHDQLGAEVRFRKEGAREWTDLPMESLPNDRWRASFRVEEQGHYRYTIRGWIDRFATWRRDLDRRVEAGQDVQAELAIGAALVDQGARRARGAVRTSLRTAAGLLAEGGREAIRAALDPELVPLMASVPNRRQATAYGRELDVVVDRERARFAAWYEMFPRGASSEPGRPGTLADAAARAPYVAAMGFDVLYLPPIHPIGRTERKGRNNTSHPEAGAPGSPWAIGSDEGGHTAIHPDLGTFRDFDLLLDTAGAVGLEVALDLAYQCSPDHPWVREHPEWFRHRPDGSIRYAENPPKKYQDIYPLDFESEAWPELWEELERVVRFWIDRRVRIFRVDNPHTKPFAFWEWLIGRIKADHPDVIFLSEAFTRPKVMYRLAKVGFTQSYTYFAWRNAKWEIESYFTELTRPPVSEFFRPNLWPNTPDILTEPLQTGGRPAFVSRLVLAATLGASYGIYGPPFELMEHRPLAPGSEEYLSSEKYEVRQWDIGREDSLAELIARLNRIRRHNPALHSDRSLRFHPVDDEHLVAYSKASQDPSNVVLTVVNLDPTLPHRGMVEVDLPSVGLEGSGPFHVHDLLTDGRYTWEGSRHFVELDPHVVPAHIFRIGPPGGPGEGSGFLP